jgi:glucose/arabinose dehydrogenase
MMVLALWRCMAWGQIELVPWANGIGQAVYVTHCGDHRLFAVSQWGAIFIIEDSMQVRDVPFLDIHERVVNNGERGMIGLAFDPDYGENGHFYVQYMATGGAYGVSTLSRFTVSPEDPNVADPDSEVILHTHVQPSAIHQAGHVEFGPDGMLYAAFGDGGWGGDPANRAQDLTSPMGKIFRIAPLADGSYAVPADNPLAAAQGDTLPEIFAYGLRNPYRFCVDPANGDLWIGDVGEDRYEEVDHWPGGASGAPNFGWRCLEGHEPYLPAGCDTGSTLVAPVHVMAHPSAGGQVCAVIGGRVVRGAAYPHRQGHYLFGELCTGEFRALWREGDDYVSEPLLTTGDQGFSSIGEGADGTLYVTHLMDHRVYKVVDHCTMPRPVIEAFGGGLQCSPGAAYQWFFQGQPIVGATEQHYSPQEEGWYTVVVDHGPGCQLVSDSVHFVATGLEQQVPTGLRIYPAPADDRVHVALPHHAHARPVVVRVHDVFGQYLLNVPWPVGEQVLHLELAHLPAATYVVVVEAGGHVLARERMVIAR